MHISGSISEYFHAKLTLPQGRPWSATKSWSLKPLGPCRIDSPLGQLLAGRQRSYYNVDETDRVLFDDTASALAARGESVDRVPGFEPAGPRRKIFFDPSKTRAGIVTCGGLCPGFNDVIRGLVMELHYLYGVRKIVGFCNGYQGFIAKYKRPVLELTPQFVSQINEHGGTILGTSRGRAGPGRDRRLPGADGRQRAVRDRRRRHPSRGARDLPRRSPPGAAKIAVVGIPKTIDNDISFIDQSFGFQTAFSVAGRGDPGGPRRGEGGAERDRRWSS